MRAALAILILLFAAGSLSAFANPSPKPSPVTKHIVVHVRVPATPLHTEFVVEVNKLGQVVRVTSGKSSKDLTFNAQTYGNVLQMWIRHPDGSAEVGTYRVTFDYSPKTHKIVRGVAILKSGGTWGNQPGAVNQMLATDRKDAAKDAQSHPTPQPVHLPSLESITGSPVPKGTKHP